MAAEPNVNRVNAAVKTPTGGCEHQQARASRDGQLLLCSRDEPLDQSGTSLEGRGKRHAPRTPRRRLLDTHDPAGERHAPSNAATRDRAVRKLGRGCDRSTCPGRGACLGTSVLSRRWSGARSCRADRTLPAASRLVNSRPRPSQLPLNGDLYRGHVVSRRYGPQAQVGPGVEPGRTAIRR